LIKGGQGGFLGGLKKVGKKIKFMQGNEACSEGAIAAGVRFFAGIL